MKLKERAQRSIRCLLCKKVRGGVQIFVLCLCILLCIVVLYRVLFDYERVQITHDAVDDAITTALVSSCIFNTDELALSGSTVIYSTVTPVKEPNYIISIITGEPVLDTTPYDTINDAALLNPGEDAFLTQCYERFERNLKKNLKLDDAMNATISGIDGTVAISEFTVFNKFFNVDEDGNQTDFRIVKYTYVPGGSWTAYPYNINQYAESYNSLDHTSYEVCETSVSACITFRVVTGTFIDWAMPGGNPDDMKTAISYQRIVDIIN